MFYIVTPVVGGGGSGKFYLVLVNSRREHGWKKLWSFAGTVAVGVTFCLGRLDKLVRSRGIRIREKPTVKRSSQIDNLEE